MTSTTNEYTQVQETETSMTTRRRRRRTRWEVHIPLVIICLIVALPALYAVQVATLENVDALEMNPPRLFPPGADLGDNVEILFDNRDFGTMLVNTAIVSLVVVVAKIGIAMLAGVAFVYFKFPGKWFLFFVILLTLLMPTEIILVPLFDLVGKEHLGWLSQQEGSAANPRLALTMPFIGTAIGVFLFRQHFSNIPRELVEAAQIDGASPLRFLYSILLPMSWNVIAALAIIQFITMWHQYIWPKFIISDPEDQMIQVGVRNAAGISGTTDFGLLMAAGVVASIPPVIIFVLLQKQFMNGFALTRDK
ncbi:MAG: carbohydrate ABC transporter permease [Chloroflexi bacterium]|nr:carbohydrate ABC transporter permease [Chloroflexota bacterium]